MINLHINLTNPFRTEKFRNLFCVSKKLTTNKAVEFEVLYYSKDLLNFEIDVTFKTDHAGLNFEFGLFGYSIHFIFYDVRHWNNDIDDYEIYEEY